MTAQPAPPARPGNWWLRQLFAAGLVLAVVAAVVVGLGLAQKAGLLSSGSGPGQPASSDNGQAVHTCPMHPQIRQPGPGRCPICGMDLVPATTSADNQQDLAVTITPAARRLANIQTAEAKTETLTATIETVGAIAIDESRMATVASYIDGRIERLFADYTGVQVAEGDHLAVIYSPDLYSAQVEYLESRQALADSRPGTLEAVRQAQTKLSASARQRLVELGMTADQITELESSGTARSRLTIYSPDGGTVIEKLAQEGKYVTAGEPIYRVADLSTVWLMLELYPEDAARVRFGQRVEATLQSLPGQTLTGRVAFIAPTVSPQQRTVGVRVELLNADGRLRPGDYATATIFLPIGRQGEVYDADLAGRWISPMHPQIIRDEPGACPICGMDLVPTARYGYADEPVQQPQSLYVPRSAVLMAGSDSVVYVETEPGRFELQPVTLGPLLKDRVVILDGLQAGQQVATAGNFLIDSQMQLAGKPSLIDPTRAVAGASGSSNVDQPLQFPDISITVVAGDAGLQLEQLYQNYFDIQESLASDQQPAAADVRSLQQIAQALADDPQLTEPAREQLQQIATHSEHLHHLELQAARLQAFRPVSHAVITLATQVRGASAAQPFQQMFCPMVKGGSGDWLQNSDQLRNPYYGAQMLKCGDLVRQLPVPQQDDPAEQEPDSSRPD